MTEPESGKQSYFFPILFLVPGFEARTVEGAGYRITKRVWGTSLFDLALLAARHRLHLPYQVMDVFLSRCNLELEVAEQPSLEAAIRSFRSLRIAMYAGGVSPFLCPFASTLSINAYSGVHSKPEDLRAHGLDPEMRQRLQSETNLVEAWPVELSLQCTLIPDRLAVDSSTFSTAVSRADRWLAIAAGNASLSLAGDAATAAPTLVPLSQSLLHIWSGLEALFPSVNSELAFRLALYLAQLCGGEQRRSETYALAREAYRVRSKVSHGGEASISFSTWKEAWGLLAMALRSALSRGRLPTEEELMAEMLSEERAV